MRVALLLAALLAGCMTPAPHFEPDAALTIWPRGVHPWPSGDEWPAGLSGPFELLELERVQVPSHDGTPLDGWIRRPAVPEGVQVPVVLSTSPYFGQLYATPDHPAVPGEGSLPSSRIVAEGFAVAEFSVRGTGNSGGCFSMLGEAERKDAAFLVEWLASQEWSNGRVGMTGGSYDGTTPWQAAVQNPPSLKTIVPVASLTDLYLWHHTVNGAAIAIGPAFQSAYVGITSYLPPLLGAPTAATVDHAPRLPERTCEETRRVVEETWSGTGDDRDGAFWEERRIHDEMANVTAAVWIAHGFYDRRSHRGGSMQEDDAYWSTLTSPKRAILGPWGHEDPAKETWTDDLVAWFDFWLKGEGEPPGVGLVEVQDTDRAWREARAWPPEGTHREVLYADSRALTPAPGVGDATFPAIPSSPEAVLCAGGEAYLSEPLGEPAFLAGEPFAFLRLSTDQPGGLVQVTLFDVPPEGCATATRIAIGAADLRFLSGNYVAEPFPVGEPTSVRIDFHDVAHALAAGHRVALVVNGHDPRDFFPHAPYAPMVTIHADGSEASSHVVLPIAEGTVGGSAPTIPYPPRPFNPIAVT